MSKFEGFHYAVLVNAASGKAPCSANVGDASTGVGRLGPQSEPVIVDPLTVVCHVEASEAAGPTNDGSHSRITYTFEASVPQFFQLLSTLEEAEAALVAQELSTAS